MKLLIVHHTDVLGGAEKSISELVGGLVQNGVEVHAILPPKGKLSHVLKKAGAKTISVSIPKVKRTLNPMKLASYVNARAKFSRMAREKVEELGIDVVHFNSLTAAVLFSDGLTKIVPTLLHLRDSIVPKIAFSSLAGNLTAYVAISDYMQSVLSDYLSVPGHKIFRINNGVHMPSPPSAEERRKARKNLGYEPDEIAFLSASAFVPWKNQRSFLDAYKTVKNKIPNSRIVICGDDISGENSNVASRINSGVRGLGDLAEAPGYVEDLTPYFHAADVFVHPAIGEPFGRVVVEAQAAGLPVVCYRSGSMEQVVAEGETGLIAELEAKKLGEKLLQIAKDEELRARLASNAPRHAAQFSVEKCVQGIYDLYGKMVSGDLPQPEKKQKKPTPQKELLRQRQLRDRKRKETTQ